MAVLLNKKYYYNLTSKNLWKSKSFSEFKKFVKSNFTARFKFSKRKIYKKRKMTYRSQLKQKILCFVHGIVHLKFTSNNILATLTDLNGRVLAVSSGGLSGFKGSHKSTKYAKEIVLEQIGKKARLLGFLNICLHFHKSKVSKRLGVKMFNKSKLKIRIISDFTRLPHNGCRPPKIRRI